LFGSDDFQEKIRENDNNWAQWDDLAAALLYVAAAFETDELMSCSDEIIAKHTT